MAPGSWRWHDDETANDIASRTILKDALIGDSNRADDIGATPQPSGERARNDQAASGTISKREIGSLAARLALPPRGWQ